MGWEPRRNQWYTAEIIETPEILLDTLPLLTVSANQAGVEVTLRGRLQIRMSCIVTGMPGIVLPSSMFAR